ncbi:hypothetical protein EJ02DRAFT_153640 [Clathrospora elynae]|uniref:AttH domain-containing protein n=1 Tax=Clathrospora elynae TaxID=706981 RepID=A0A6A5S4C1_9PLEO|nr:hypothetical protein EJ02DRAFT_153640 [Clathrospora elynae]
MRSLILSAIALLGRSVVGEVINLDTTVSDGPVEWETKSKEVGLLGMSKVFPVNQASTDCWYFDFISTSSDYSALLILVQVGTQQIFDTGNTTIRTSLKGTYADGSSFTVGINAEDITFREPEDKTFGLDFGTELKIDASSSLLPNPVWRIDINSSSADVYGSLTVKSIAPAHVPCSLDGVGVDELLTPQIAWTNSVPDGDGTADLMIQGKPLNLKGLGYVDKIWTGVQSAGTWQYWYWGHTRLGPYSFVFYQVQPTNDTLKTMAYITKDGKPLIADCVADDVLTIESYGENSIFPPVTGTPAPSGLTIRYDLGCEGIFNINLTTQGVLSDTLIQVFAYGTTVGGMEGEEVYHGNGTYEVNQPPVV